MGELWTTKSECSAADRPHLWLRRPPGNLSACAGARGKFRRLTRWGNATNAAYRDGAPPVVAPSFTSLPPEFDGALGGRDDERHDTVRAGSHVKWNG